MSCICLPGPWECEYSYGGEADLHRHYTRCTKNPGHKNFIPVDKFCIEDLPEDYRDKVVINYIRAVSDLTVRVKVEYVSDKRPETVPGIRKSYPGYSFRGQRRATVGTGGVFSIKFSNEEEGQTCKCKVCRISSTPETNFAIITIHTATHVVFDDLEGEHTTCHLFFDRGGTPDACSGVVALTGMSRVLNEVIKDICLIEYHTHNLDLAHRLEKTIMEIHELMLHSYNQTPNMTKLKHCRSIQDRQPLLFMVSHPHGCSKQVSLGRWTSADVSNRLILSFQYSTSTCPGSSGARICVFPELSTKGVNLSTYTLFLPSLRAHCGASFMQLGESFGRVYEGQYAFLYL
ncbi:unnamed protein product [Candidula unifasciata]|uniref:Uncharacterized protein n=1 Tax=Candidula unifasciata TaxID=100452 RepID=A0A8S3ZX99_9EUPU|nr:unnamed protein product [Candidula unifasciata]